MTNAIGELQMRLRVLEANEPVNRAEGNIAQSGYERAVIAEIREAIAVLIAADIERKRAAAAFADKPAGAGRTTASTTASTPAPNHGTPHKCPVCNGVGAVGYPPGTLPGQSFTSSSIGPWPCNSCHGSGVLWA